jgi:hypothetical protein
MTTQSSGEWRAERLYVLKTIEDLKSEQRRMSESAAIERAGIIEKGVRDIQQAHDKIRALENSAHLLALKNWVLAGVLSTVGVVTFELLKWVFHK